MALNIKNAEVESLAAEVAKLARESKTEAIRVALKERAFRLKSYRGKLSRAERIDLALAHFREQFPNADYGGDSGEAERWFRREAERHSGMIPNTIGA
jgi:antitoxin VapB